MIWPDTLLQDLAERRALIVVGAGVSAAAIDRRDLGKSLPLWRDFLRAGIERLGQRGEVVAKLMESGDLISACALLQRGLGDDWVGFVRQMLAGQFEGSALHDAIIGLDQNFHISLNFDTILESRFRSRSSREVVVKRYYDSDTAYYVRSREQLVIKMHGDIDDIDKIVITRKSYAEFRNTRSAFLRLVESLFLHNTAIFIGCGLSDPNVSLMMENLRISFGGARPHYFLIGDDMNEEYRRVVEESQNIRFLFYSVSSEYDKLPSVLTDLVDRVALRRNEMIAATVLR